MAAANLQSFGKEGIPKFNLSFSEIRYQQGELEKHFYTACQIIESQYKLCGRFVDQETEKGITGPEDFLRKIDVRTLEGVKDRQKALTSEMQNVMSLSEKISEHLTQLIKNRKVAVNKASVPTPSSRTVTTTNNLTKPTSMQKTQPLIMRDRSAPQGIAGKNVPAACPTKQKEKAEVLSWLKKNKGQLEQTIDHMTTHDVYEFIHSDLHLTKVAKACSELKMDGKALQEQFGFKSDEQINAQFKFGTRLQRMKLKMAVSRYNDTRADNNKLGTPDLSPNSSLAAGATTSPGVPMPADAHARSSLNAETPAAKSSESTAIAPQVFTASAAAVATPTISAVAAVAPTAGGTTALAAGEKVSSLTAPAGTRTIALPADPAVPVLPRGRAGTQ